MPRRPTDNLFSLGVNCRESTFEADSLLIDPILTCCEPPHVLAHTWDYEDTASEVCYELTEVGEQVRLVITHSRLTGRDEMQSVCGGWHTHMDILVDVLNGVEPQPFWKVHTALEAEYEERLTQAT